PAAQARGARVGSGMDRLLARADGRRLHLAARAGRPAAGEAELLLPAPVLDLVRPGRALARRGDPARGRAEVLLGVGLPPSRPSAALRRRARRAARDAAGAGTIQADERQRARGVRPAAAAHATRHTRRSPLTPHLVVMAVDAGLGAGPDDRGIV